MNIKAIAMTLATVVVSLAIIHYVAPSSVKSHLGVA